MATFSLRDFVHASGLTLLQQGLTAACALSTSIVVARTLGPLGQGVYGVIFALALFTVTVGNLGVGAATVYHLGRGHFTAAMAVRQNILLAVAMGSLSALGLGLAVHVAAGRLIPGVDPQVAQTAVWLVPQLILTQYLVSCLQGMQRFIAYNIASLLAPCLTLGSTLGLAAARSLNPRSALIAYGVGQMGAAAFAWWHLRREGAAPWTFNAAYGRAMLGYGVLAYLGNALAYLNYRIDVFLLNAMRGTGVVGVYSIAVGVGERLWLLSFAVSVILMPQVAQGAGKTLTPIIARHVLWLSAAAALGLAAIAPWALPFIFGPPFAASVPLLWALLPGLVCFSLARVLSHDIAGRGRPGLNAALGAATLLLNVLANLAFIGPWGALGAACAASLAYGCDSVCKVWIYCRQSGTPARQVLLLQPDDWQRLMKLWRLT